MTLSSPSFLSSFDPALHLHSQDDIAPHPPSESFADDLEALNLQRLEHKRDVIQHRAWDLADVFRSDDDIRPGLSFLVVYVKKIVHGIDGSSFRYPDEAVRVHDHVYAETDS